GTVVEDSLYAFGKLQIGDHPSHSLIFDPGDSESYIKNGGFTEEKIEEIKTYKNFKPVELPDDIKQYSNKFNYQSTIDIRKVFNEKHSWEKFYNCEKHFDLNWVKHSVYTPSTVSRGEGASITYSIRKSLKRIIENVNNHVHQPVGRGFDYLIRESNSKIPATLSLAQIKWKQDDKGKKRDETSQRFKIYVGSAC
ncbi:hypothetical protein K501DRAFT_201423, partial [Backusella circina FSU 941]